MAGSIVQTAKQSSALGTVTATFPSATTAGNVIVIGFASDDYNASPGTGWFQQTGCEQQTFHGGYLWYRISAGETSFQYVIGSATNSAFVVAEISGLDTSDLYDVSNGQFTQVGGQTTYTTPAITPSTGDRFLVAFMGASEPANLSAVTWGTWLNSFTAIDSIGSGGAGTNDLAGLAYRRVTGDGSTTFSSGATASNVTASRSGIIISFKEAAALGPLVDLTASSVTTSSPTIGAPALAPLLNISILTGGTQANSAINGGNVTLTFPTLQQGDVVIVFGGHFARGGATSAIPTGYTPIYDSGNTLATDPHFGVSYKVMGATPDTTVSCPGSGNAADGTAYGCYCLRNVDTTVIQDATRTVAGPTTSNNPDCPSITTVTDRALILALALDHLAGTGDTAITNPTNYIEQRTARGADNNDATVCGAAIIEPVAGTEDPPSFTAWTAGTWRTATVAIRVATSATALSASSFTRGATTFTGSTNATLTQTHVFSAPTFTGAAKTIGAPAFTGIVGLSASSLTTTAAVVGAPALVRIVGLSASSLTTTAASVGAPAFVTVLNLAASTLTRSAATIGAPSFVGVVIASASNLVTTTPSIGAPSMLGGVDLTAASVTTTAAIVGTPSFAAISNLSASSFTEVAVSFTTPAVGYKEGLSPAGVTVTAVSFSQAALALFGVMTATPVATATPTFTAAAIAQTHNFSPVNVTTSVVLFADADLVYSVNLAASSITTTAPSIGSGAFAFVHVLTADSVALSELVIGEATFVGVSHLTASNVQTQEPSIGVPDVVAFVHLDADGFASTPPVLVDADINQRQVLGASVLSTGPPTFPNLQLFLAGQAAAANLVLQNILLGEPEFVERVSHLVPTSFTTTAPIIASASFKQINAFTAGTITIPSPSLVSAVVVQSHVFTTVDQAVSVVIDTPAFNQTVNLDAVGIDVVAPSIQSPQVRINLTAASFTRQATTLASTVIQDYTPPLQVGTFTAQQPIVGSPLFQQKQLLSNTVLAQGYPILPSPLFMTRLPIEIDMTHKARIIGVPTHKKGMVAGVAERGSRITIVGRPLPSTSRNI